MSIQIQVTEKYSTDSVLVVMVMLVMIEANRELVRINDLFLFKISKVISTFSQEEVQLS